MMTMTNHSLEFNTPSVLGNSTEVSASEIAVNYTYCEDARILLIFENTGSDGVITVKGGDSIQGGDDLEISVSGGERTALVLESGKYMQTSGDNAGCVVAYCDGTFEVTVIELP